MDPKDAGPHAPPHVVVENIPDYLLAPVLTLRRQGTVDATQNPPCHCVLEFTGISVADEDPTIDLTARWFVDYDATKPATVFPRAQEELPGNFNDVTQTVRELKNVFQLDADAMNIVTSGTHIVELVVGEKTGFDTTSAASQPNRSMLPGFVSAIYKWAIDVHLEQVTGQCLTAPPSKQVCG